MSIASTIPAVSANKPPSALHDNATAVSLRDVVLTYPGNVTALRGISLEIPAGKHVVILGASGSGKTSLLGVLSGRLKATAGEFRCDGRIAMIHQDLRLVKQRSARQNVLHGSMGRHGLWRTLIGFPRDERARAIQLLRRVGLEHRIHTPVGRLSGGEQQRVAIARALMQDPTILLADEPVASLDNANARAIMRLLSELQREHGLTLISVLHDCALAETFADRILGFEAGRIIHDDTASDGQKTIGHKNAPEIQMGLRGFRRFEACVACETLATTSDSPPVANVYKAPTKWRYAAAALIAIVVYAWAIDGLSISQRATEDFLPNIMAFFATLVPNSWQQAAGIEWGRLLISLIETLQMALLGTSLAVVISWPLAAIAARNIGPRWLRPAARFLLNAIRSVPSILWALLFVAAVGLGTFAGILALVFYSIGYLTKFYYEAFEAVEPGPPDALREIGASGLQRFFHAVWPAARAAVLSSSLFMLEYNVRAASVLGIVGAGGIGYELKLQDDYRNFHIVGAIVLLLIVVVLILDAVSSRIRARLMKP